MTSIAAMFDLIPGWAFLILGVIVAAMIGTIIIRKAIGLAIGLVIALIITPWALLHAAAYAADHGHPYVAHVLEAQYRIRIEPRQRVGEALLGRAPLRLTPDGFSHPVECWIRPSWTGLTLECPGTPITPR